LVEGLPEGPQLAVAGGGAVEYLPGPVDRAVIDRDHLAHLRALQHVLQDQLDGPLFVVGRHHH